MTLLFNYTADERWIGLYMKNIDYGKFDSCLSMNKRNNFVHFSTLSRKLLHSLFTISLIALSSNAYGQANPGCGNYTITFDEPGLIPPATATSTTVINTQYAIPGGANPLPAGAGVTISATGGANGAGNPALDLATVYNSNITGGQDPDLENGSGFGNLVILQENNGWPTNMSPDDDTDGTIIFDFELPMNEFSGTFVDFEEGDVQFEFYDLDDMGGVLGVAIVTNAELEIGSGSIYEQGPGSGCNLADGAVCNISNGLTTGSGGGTGLIGIDEIDRIIVNLGIAPASGGIDNVGLEVACTTLSLSGNVFNDLDGLDDSTVDGTGTDAGGLFVSLIPLTEFVGDVSQPIATPVVTQSIAVNPDGTYNFDDIDPNTQYRIQLNTAAQTIGAVPSAPDLPGDFINTGENLGAGAGNDGSVDGILDVQVITEDIVQANFGIQETGTITGNVSEDTTGDGIANTPLDDVTVQLYTDPNGDGDPSDGVFVDSTTTDASGDYSFTDLVRGDYVVVEIDPADYKSIADGDDQTPGDPGGDAANAAAPLGELDNLVPVGLAAGETDADNNFVDIITASVEGTVWLDEDLDGIFDTEETGITGVTVQLLDGATVVATTVTDANGDYSFEDVTPGTYDVNVIDGADTPLENLDNTAGVGGIDPKSVTVNAGDMIVDVDFGYIPEPNEGAIGDRVWADADSDGVQDPGEAGIEGVVLTLLDNTGATVGTTTTNANGDYLFTGVPFGEDYVVSISPSDARLTGFTPTTGPQSEGGYVGNPVTLEPTLAVVTDVDFGFDNPTLNTISDTVWFDEDANGVLDPDEQGIDNVTVDLLSAEFEIIDGRIDINGDGNTVNNSDTGFYFGYAINQNGRIDINGDNAFNGLDDGFVNGVEIINAFFDIDGNGNIANNAGGRLADDGTIGSSVLATTTTDANGDLEFTGLPDGTYKLVVTDNNDELDGLNGTTDEGVARESVPVSVSGGSTDDDTSFGYNNPGLISGTVYSDNDSNNDQDPGELGIEGQTVTLLQDTDGNGSYETTVDSILTDPTGFYEFDGLPPGDYQVVVTSPGGTQTEDPDATINDETDITLGIGESSVQNDFGYNSVPDLYDLSGTVFLDPNKNGIEDAGEVGIPDITLDLISPEVEIIDGRIDLNGDGNTLNNSDIGFYFGYAVNANGRIDINGDSAFNTLDDGFVNGVEIINTYFDIDGNGNITNNPGGRLADDGIIDASVLATTTTDANGDYEFTGLTNGDYQVEVTDTSGLLAGYDITSGLDIQDETIDNADVIDVDFGYIKEEATGSIAGEVFLDEDGDGIADDTETNFPNETVYLCFATDAPCNSGNAIQTTTTDANGDYLFTDLPPGVYEVGVEPTGSNIPPELIETVNPDPVSLSEGENVTEVDIGYQGDTLGVLSGFVWTDANGNGAYDPGEVPIGGVDITVYNSSGVIGTTSTNPDGTWIIADIPVPDAASADDLLVVYDPADVPANLNEVQPTNMTTGNDRYTDVDLFTDDNNNIGNLDFGFEPEVTADLGSISGTTYSEETQNNVYDSGTDTPIEGVKINLIDDATGDVIATTLTDSNGDYSFDGLQDGDYRVEIIGSDNNALQDVNPNTDTLETEGTAGVISIASGSDYFDADAGFISDPRLGSIGNRFWFDEDADGFIDENEPGIPGIIIQCWLDADESETPNDPNATTNAPVPGVDNLIRTVKTDENGEYYCTSLPSGQYIVVVADSAGFVEGVDGTMVTGNVGDNFAKPWTYALTTNSPNYTADFGITGLNSISGNVFIEDSDLVEPAGSTVATGELDGVQGGPSPDSPSVGTTVILYRIVDGDLVEFATTTTDINGDYSFTDLPDGEYVVEVVPPGTEFGQTGDPSLLGSPGDSSLVCDSGSGCDNLSDVIDLVDPGNLDITDVDFGYQENFVTTPVTLTFFKAESADGGVKFTWETANEIGHLGYQIYARGEDDWVLLNDELILSKGGAALDARTYSYTAYNVDATWFALVDVSTTEELTLHGPYRLGETNGQALVETEAFDWDGVNMPKQTKSEVSESVNDRLRQLLEPDEREQRATTQ